MPFINTETAPAPLVFLAGSSTLEVAGGLASQFRAHLSGHSSLLAHGSNLIEGAVLIEGESTLYGFGRIGAEPNVFGQANLVNIEPSPLFADGLLLITSVAVLSGSSDMFAGGRVNSAESATLNIFLTIAAESDAGSGATYSARIYADGNEYLIKSFNYSEPRSNAGVSLECVLLKPSDRAAILAANFFTFDLYDAGAWVTLFAGGKRGGAGYSFALSDARPDDSLSISTIAPVASKLELSPLKNLTIYDPTREEIDAADFPPVYDTNGAAYNQELRAVGGLNLFSLLQIVFVEKCGFAGYKTTLPNFPIRRADFTMTGTFLEGIAGHVGMFNPLIFVKNDVVWLLDSTAGLPAGLGAPVVLTADDYKTAQFTQNELNIDGYILQFSENETDFDYSTTRIVEDPPDTTGSFGDSDFTETTRRHTYRDFFKNSDPITPVRSDKISEFTGTRAVVEGSLTTVSEETESFSYDAFGRITKIEKEESALIPDVGSNGAAPPFFTTVRSEKTDFFYKPDAFDPRRQFLAQTLKRIRGLVAVDAENQSLGKTFYQDFKDGYRAGNFTEETTTTFDRIRTVIETATQNQRGQIEVKIKTIDFMTDPPQVIHSTTDARSGDNTLNGQTSAQKDVIVLRQGAPRTNAKLQPLSVAELPIELAVPLARRRLARQSAGQGSVSLLSINRAIGRGSILQILDGNDQNVGNFLCEGRSIAGGELGTFNQQTTMILEVTKV